MRHAQREAAFVCRDVALKLRNAPSPLDRNLDIKNSQSPMKRSLSRRGKLIEVSPTRELRLAAKRHNTMRPPIYGRMVTVCQDDADVLQERVDLRLIERAIEPGPPCCFELAHERFVLFAGGICPVERKCPRRE